MTSPARVSPGPDEADVPRSPPRGWAVWLGLAGLLLLAWLAYRPGLSGTFQFDDFVNLPALGSRGPIDDWSAFWRYVTAGTADPTGRPIAMLSFLLEARDWPAPAYPFLRDNVLLHLLNGVLLFLLLNRLGSFLSIPSQRASAAALLAAGAWLLHPLLVSTTLYIVQRHAMLPATFTLLGLLAYAHGRALYASTAGGKGMALMLAGVLVGSLLAVLSKGNGILLPLLALVLDRTVFVRADASLDARPLARFRRVRLLVLVVPSLLLAAWLASYLSTLGQAPGVREWTTEERLLTQPRALVDYLGLLLVPRSLSTGLFNDGYAASKGLLQPWSTLPSLLLVVALIGASFALRRRHPAWSAALLFFFAGHLMESSILPLELYFEHRNYLPAMLFFWPAALALSAWQRPFALRATVGVLALFLLASITWQRSTLWGQPERMAAIWARQQQDSPRAQAAAAIAATEAGRPEAALRTLLPAWRARPHDLQIAFNVIDARCAGNGPTPAEKRALAEALRRTPRSELLTHRWLSAAIDGAVERTCPGLELDDVAGWVDAAIENPIMGKSRLRDEDIEPLLAQVALARRQPDVALGHLNRALRATASPDAAARHAVLLASNEYYEQALAHLDLYERIKSASRRPPRGMPTVHAWVMERQGYWRKEMAILRAKLQAEIAAREQSP